MLEIMQRPILVAKILSLDPWVLQYLNFSRKETLEVVVWYSDGCVFWDNGWLWYCWGGSVRGSGSGGGLNVC